jgi:hypothetical protein
VLKPGGVVVVREPQKCGDWAAGPSRKAIILFVRLVIEDAFKSVGGDPLIGRRLGTLSLDAGFERVEVTPGYSPAISNVSLSTRMAESRCFSPCARAINSGMRPSRSRAIRALITGGRLPSSLGGSAAQSPPEVPDGSLAPASLMGSQHPGLGGNDLVLGRRAYWRPPRAQPQRASFFHRDARHTAGTSDGTLRLARLPTTNDFDDLHATITKD